MTKMYPQQVSYQAAKQAYDALIQESGERQNMVLDTWTGNLTGEDLDAYAEVAVSIEAEIGLPQAIEALRKAEHELIAWGVAYCEKHPDYNPLIAELAETKSIVMRERVCTTILKLGLFD